MKFPSSWPLAITELFWKPQWHFITQLSKIINLLKKKNTQIIEHIHKHLWGDAILFRVPQLSTLILYFAGKYVITIF